MSRLKAIQEKTNGPEFKDHVDPESLELTPPPGGLVKSNWLNELQSFIRNEVSRAAQGDGYGSFEEEDDFDMTDEEGLPLTAGEAHLLDQVEDRPPEPEEAPRPSEASEAPSEGQES